MWGRKRASGLGVEAERTIQQGRFLCPREGVDRPWRVVAIRRKSTGHENGKFELRAHPAHASALVCDGCSHRFDLEAARPISRQERVELVAEGLAMTLSGMSRERVDDPVARAAEIARASAAAGLTSLPTFDPFAFEALALRLDARLLPDQREVMIRTACDVGRSGRAKPYFSSVLQTLSGALGYSMEEVTGRLGAG